MAQSALHPTALTIAGSDSGGGAGIQADLKTFAMHSVHGASVVTCVTAQNTCGVFRVDTLPVESVVAQWKAVVDDMPVAALKTGMLLNQPIIDAVCQCLESASVETIVVDPVMISRSGDRLLDDSAIDSIRSRLLPLANVLTPNVYEAELLSGTKIESVADMKAAAEKIRSTSAACVLIKGGGLSGSERGVDVWFDGVEMHELVTENIDTPNTHGTGCSLSAAITANCAKGVGLLESCRAAKQYVTEGLRHSFSPGQGSGPIGHFHPLLR